jgi:hypothetical protein
MYNIQYCTEHVQYILLNIPSPSLAKQESPPSDQWETPPPLEPPKQQPVSVPPTESAEHMSMRKRKSLSPSFHRVLYLAVAVLSASAAFSYGGTW